MHNELDLTGQNVDPEIMRQIIPFVSKPEPRFEPTPSLSLLPSKNTSNALLHSTVPQNYPPLPSLSVFSRENMVNFPPMMHYHNVPMPHIPQVQYGTGDGRCLPSSEASHSFGLEAKLENTET